jgi:NAD(P)-dependent dehydrogenase (short-subunit alcohol dehydrogenase family)
MDYFVTGGTGFIGRFLVGKLLERGGNVHVLVREASSGRFEALRARYAQAADRLHAVAGDLGRPRLGLADADLERLRGRIGGFFHVAAIYDMGASAESQQVANVEGTRHAVQAAQALDAACLHHVSSIAVAGMYDGAFSEDMFAEAGTLEHPYFKTKHDSEAVVRQQCQVPWRIYRPASVVGHSQHRRDRQDRRSLLLLQGAAAHPQHCCRRGCRWWASSRALQRRAGRLRGRTRSTTWRTSPGQDGECFHIVDTEHHSTGEMMNIFAEAAHAPRLRCASTRRCCQLRARPGLSDLLAKLPPVKRIEAPPSSRSFGMPPNRLHPVQLEHALRVAHDAQGCSKAAASNARSSRPTRHRLWYYWETQLDPDLFVDNSLEGNVRGKLVIITGGGTGIGLATALRLAGAGARIVIAGRTLEKLEETAQKAIQAAGGICHIYRADLADMPACDAFIDQVIADHGQVDILINNAGRSIRRSIEYSYDRFHDFERTMQINYYSPLRLSSCACCRA